MTSTSLDVGRQISLPWSEAFRISVRNIVIRLGRALVTASGVFLGIAFLMSVLTSGLITEALGEEIGQEIRARMYWLISMSLLVCTVGIMNSMFMSVTERFKEIGTMKCLGALDSFVVRLFLIESGLMGVVGSVGGAIFGFLFMMLVSAIHHGFGIFVEVSYGNLLMYLLYSVGLGVLLSVIAAIPPAFQAARMPPACALRIEI